MKTTEYSFCEGVHSGPNSKWHIRKLSDIGRKLGGGADTLSLCGKQVPWDMKVEVTYYHLNNNSCKKCLEEYNRRRVSNVELE
jgi:hypothetical protein